MSLDRVDQCLNPARSALPEIACRYCLHFHRASALLLRPFHPRKSKYFWALYVEGGRDRFAEVGGRILDQFATFSGRIILSYLPFQLDGGWC